jgi:phosphonate transport system substrate-binding protein
MLTTPWNRLSALLAASVLTVGMVSACSNEPTTTSTDATATDASAEGGACAPELTEIDFGILSTESQEALKPKWDPFIMALEEGVGRKVNAFYANDYAGVIEGMAAGKVQLAWLGGKSYIEAAERADAEVFARVINEDGTKGYYSHLITNVDNPIVQEIDLDAGNGDQYVIENGKELTFAFNDPNSTSGFLVPSYYVFAKNGVNPKTAFQEEPIFAGSHEATLQAVINNQVDVATNNSEQLINLEKNNPDDLAKVQVIWTSPEIPSDPIAYRKDMPDCLKEKIKDFVYNYDDVSILNPLGWAGFEAAKDEDWNPIRELNIGTQILEVQADENLSEADKQQKIEALNKQLEAL